jgi:hypothetical protein
MFILVLLLLNLSPSIEYNILYTYGLQKPTLNTRQPLLRNLIKYPVLALVPTSPPATVELDIAFEGDDVVIGMNDALGEFVVESRLPWADLRPEEDLIVAWRDVFLVVVDLVEFCWPVLPNPLEDDIEV